MHYLTFKIIYNLYPIHTNSNFQLSSIFYSSPYQIVWNSITLIKLILLIIQCIFIYIQDFLLLIKNRSNYLMVIFPIILNSWFFVLLMMDCRGAIWAGWPDPTRYSMGLCKYFQCSSWVWVKFSQLKSIWVRFMLRFGQPKPNQNSI